MRRLAAWLLLLVAGCGAPAISVRRADNWLLFREPVCVEYRVDNGPWLFVGCGLWTLETPDAEVEVRVWPCCQ